MDERLVSFVEKCLERGIPRPEIHAALLQAGWKAEQIKSILSAYADINFPLPIPTPHPTVSAREAYLYLLLFTTLYMVAWNLGSLIFEWLDYFHAHAGIYTRFPWNESRSALATLLTATPIYVYVARMLKKSLIKTPEQRYSPVRKWLTYLTLFITASVLIGDMIHFTYTALGEQLTRLYILKFLTVAIINSTIFGYYLDDMQRDERAQECGYRPRSNIP